MDSRNNSIRRHGDISSSWTNSSPAHPFFDMPLYQQDVDSFLPFAPSKKIMESINKKESANDFMARCQIFNQQQLLTLVGELYQSVFSLHTLMKTAVSMNKDTHKTSSLRRIVEETHRVVPCDHVTLYLVDNDRKIITVAWTDDNAVDQQAEIPIGKGIVGMVADRGRSVRVTQERVSMNTCPEYNSVSGNQRINIIASPIYDTNRKVIAVLTACSRSAKRKDADEGFTDQDRSMMRFVAALAGYTIQNILLFDEMKVRREESEVLQHMVEQMTQDLHSGREAVIHDMITSTYTLMKCDRISYFSVDHERDELVCEVSKDAKGMRVGMGEGIVGYVAKTGKATIVNDVANDPRWSESLDLRTHIDTKNILSIPILDDKNKCLGVIQAVNKIARPDRLTLTRGYNDDAKKKIQTFDGNDVKKMAVLCKSVQVIIKKAEQLEQLRIQTEELKALNRKNQALVGVLRAKMSRGNPENIWKHIVQLTYQILNCSRISVFTVDEERQVCHINISKDLQKDVTIEYGQGIVGYVAQTGETVRLDDPYADRRFFREFDRRTDFKTDSLMACPISDRNGRRVGVIEALNKANGPFSETDEKVLESIASEISEVLRSFQTQTMLTTFIEENGGLAEWLHQFERQNVLYALPQSGLSESSRTMKAIDKDKISPAGTFFAVPSLAPMAPRPTLKLPSHLPNQHLVKSLATTEFDSLFYEREQLNQFALSIFMSTGLIDDLKIPIEKLWNFINAVSGTYRQNPFHNWSHGFHVLQFTYFLIMKTNVTSYLRNIDVFAMLIAAMCHDVDHPGNNNDFEILMETERAFLYNDISVLENHHAHTAFSLLRDEEHNIFAHFPKSEQREFRKIIVNAILATDMAHHGEIVSAVRNLEPDNLIDKQERQERQLLVNFIVHLGDLSAQCYSWDIAKQWEARITREFYNQTQMELDEGIPAFIEGLDDPSRRFLSQVGFIDCVLKDFWRAASDLIQELKPVYQQLNYNRNMYKDLADNWKDREFEKIQVEENIDQFRMQSPVNSVHSSVTTNASATPQLMITMDSPISKPT